MSPATNHNERHGRKKFAANAHRPLQDPAWCAQKTVTLYVPQAPRMAGAVDLHADRTVIRFHLHTLACRDHEDLTATREASPTAHLRGTTEYASGFRGVTLTEQI